MAEPHIGSDFDQAGLHGRRRGLNGDAETVGRPPDQRAVTRRISGGQLQEAPGLDGQAFELADEAVFNPAGQR